MSTGPGASAEVSGTGPRAGRLDRGHVALVLAALALPLLGLVVLVAAPHLDEKWQHNPAHFWIVLVAGTINAVLAYATGAAARLRGDARVFLVSMSFLSAAGFLGLHALATPGVLLSGSNPGFEVATPVGLLVAACFAAASSLELTSLQAAWVIRNGNLVVAGLIVVLIAWACASLGKIGPFGTTGAPAEQASTLVVVLAVVGFALYAVAVVRYLRLPRHAGSPLPLAMAAAFTLLAEAELAVAWGRNWHISWWEWHLLMLAAFVLIAVAAQRSWREERWAGLYREETASAEREISVVFVDLAGFTAWSEAHTPQQVTGMLNTYFTSAIPPVVDDLGGVIDRIIGDALMVTFNVRGDQPDHAGRALAAALAIQDATGALAEANPGWPRFRAGVNTGTAAVGLIGTAGARTYTAIGDAVNVASRLEGAAPVGGVALSAETLRRVPGAEVRSLGPLRLKGRSDPVDAYALVRLAGS